LINPNFPWMSHINSINSIRLQSVKRLNNNVSSAQPPIWRSRPEHLQPTFLTSLEAFLVTVAVLWHAQFRPGLPSRALQYFTIDHPPHGEVTGLDTVFCKGKVVPVF
jgi:hypothetical protein